MHPPRLSTSAHIVSGDAQKPSMVPDEHADECVDGEFGRTLDYIVTKRQYQKEVGVFSTDPLSLGLQVTMGKRIALYKLGRELGAGHYAKVRLGVHSVANGNVAIKIIDRSKLNTRSLRSLDREIAIMDTLNHPHIIKLFEVDKMIFFKS
jgi:serine/threonine protein kinase